MAGRTLRGPHLTSHWAATFTQTVPVTTGNGNVLGKSFLYVVLLLLKAVLGYL